MSLAKIKKQYNFDGKFITREFNKKITRKHYKKFRLSAEEQKEIQRKADIYCNGNTSIFLLYVALFFEIN